MGTDIAKWEIPTTKSDIKKMASNISSEVLMGDMDIIDVQAKLKWAEELIKQVKADETIKSLIDEELVKNNGSYDYLGTKFVLKTLTDYDFSHCNYKPLIEAQEKQEKLQDQLTLINEEIAEAKEFLKTLPSDIELNGDTVKAPILTSKKSIAITIKR